VPSHLSDFCRITMGQSPKGDECNSSGVGSPLLNGPTEFQLIHPSPVQWTTNPKKFSKSGDLLFCVRGSTTGRMNWSDQEYAIGRGLASISPIHEDTMHFFRGAVEAHLPSLLAGATGSTFPNVSRGDLESIPVPHPNLSYIKNASSILKALERKVELNQKMNQTLEEIAKAIFKSWFVDFDPVRAKAEGRPTGLPPEISDLFPDELVDSEIGDIPKGWSVGAIADFASLNKKTINPSQSSEIYEHFSIPAFDSGQSPVLDLGTDIKSNKTLVPEGSLLVSKLNPNTPRVWLPNPKDLHEQICSTEFMVYTATDHSNIAFLWGLFTSSLVAGRMEAMVTGTSKSHQRVKPNDVSGIMTVTPDARLVKTYGDTILPMLNRTLVGKSESTVLSELRDTLLPKLISGELRIPDAEKFLEEAGI